MKKKLNIFFSNSISAHKWGGGEKWMVTAGKGLNERGHNVILSGKSNSVFLTKAEEAVKGDSVNSSNKYVECETGLRILVPMFIEIDEIIKIDTKNNEYITRVK